MIKFIEYRMIHRKIFLFFILEEKKFKISSNSSSEVTLKILVEYTRKKIHDTVYINYSYAWFAYLFWLEIINIFWLKQNWFIYNLQLVTWSILIKADLIRYSNHLCVISRYTHSHFITLKHVLIVILCFVDIIKSA